MCVCWTQLYLYTLYICYLNDITCAVKRARGLAIYWSYDLFELCVSEFGVFCLVFRAFNRQSAAHNALSCCVFGAYRNVAWSMYCNCAFSERLYIGSLAFIN